MPHTALSKSKYTTGLKCLKLLWIQEHDRDLLTPFSDFTRAKFADGDAVGDLAKQLFPGGVEIPFERGNRKQRVRMTRDLIAQGEKVIYEASFEYDNFIVMVDILRIDDAGKWEIYEVKSKGTDKGRIPEYLIPDAAVQKYILTHCGLNVSTTCFVTPSKEYCLEESLDIQAYFEITNVDQEVDALQEGIPEHIRTMRDVLDQRTVPDISIGLQCDKPYECPCTAHCRTHIPEYSIFDINGIRRTKIFKEYYPDIISQQDITDIDTFCTNKSGKLNVKQKIEIETNLSRGIYVNREALRDFLSGIRYPIYHLDFESFTHIIPRYPGTRANQQICFQYSLHIEQKEGKPDHQEYLATSGLDPRRTLAESLIQHIPKDSRIMVYNIGFERGRIYDMIKWFPDLEDKLQNMIDNMVDLIDPFKKKMVYHWKQKGSNSIKQVLPAWLPDQQDAYHNLDIVHEGTEASRTYLELEDMEEGDKRQNKVQALLKYCKQDTESMVMLLRKLRELVE